MAKGKGKAAQGVSKRKVAADASIDDRATSKAASTGAAKKRKAAGGAASADAVSTAASDQAGATKAPRRRADPVPKDYHSAYYLMKNEPENYSIDDLEKAEGQTCCWEGVRNFQARNIMQAMKKGQRALMYHSNCKVPGAVGIIEIVREAYPDHFAYDESSQYYDAKSTPDAPRWWMVDVRLVRKFDHMITLEQIKQHKDGPLKDMQLLTNSRLSVQQVTQQQWDTVLGLAK